MSAITVVQADITKIEVDAIVNAANERMLGGGGVDGAIHRAAGLELKAACAQAPEIRPGVRCPTGQARITPGFRLPARWVIHTVGPVWQGGRGGETQLLASCYRESLSLAQAHDVREMAFPAISCGVFRFPPDQAAMIAVATIDETLTITPTINKVLLVAYDDDMFTILQDAVEAHQRSATTA